MLSVRNLRPQWKYEHEYFMFPGEDTTLECQGGLDKAFRFTGDMHSVILAIHLLQKTYVWNTVVFFLSIIGSVLFVSQSMLKNISRNLNHMQI